LRSDLNRFPGFGGIHLHFRRDRNKFWSESTIRFIYMEKQSLESCFPRFERLEGAVNPKLPANCPNRKQNFSHRIFLCGGQATQRNPLHEAES
jgi:hypothetical protein